MSSRVEQFKAQNGMQTAPVSPTGGSSRVQQFKAQLQQKPTIASQPEAPQKDGFFKSLAKGIANPFVRAGASLFAAGVGAKNAIEADAAKRRGDMAGYQRNLEEGYARIRNGVNVPFFGNTKVIQKPGLDAAGVGAEAATFFMGGGAAKGAGKTLIEQGVKQAVKQGAKTGAIVGGTSAFGASLQKDKMTIGSVAKDTAIGAGGGALFGAAAGALSKPAAKGLRNSAEESYSKAIGATTKQNKAISDKIVPELIDRKVTALTRNSLFNKASNALSEADEALEAGYKSLPPNAQTEWGPVLRNLQKAKEEITVNGVVMDVGRHRALDQIQKDLINVIGGGTKEAQDAVVSVETARKVRQILDKAVSQKTKVFGLTGKETDKLAVQKLAANSIRKQLAEEYPNIGKLNKEFNFWKNVQDVLGETIQRTKSQNPLSDQIATEGGAVVGATVKGTAGGIIMTATGFKLLKQAIQSTGWRTTSALLKSSLANSLAKGDFNKANILLQKIIESSRRKD